MADPRSTGYISQFPVPPTEDPLYESGHWYRAGADIWELDMRKNVNGFATDQAHGTSLNGHIAGSFWTKNRFSGDVEVWGRPFGGQLGAALETWRLFIFSDPWGSPSGYLVYIGGGLSKNTVLRVYDNGSSTDVASHGAGYANGLMLRVKGGNVEVWRVDFGQSITNPANWYQAISYADSTYRGPYYIGMAIEDPTNGGLAWHGIGGGKRLHPQIYRWLKGWKVVDEPGGIPT